MENSPSRGPGRRRGIGGTQVTHGCFGQLPFVGRAGGENSSLPVTALHISRVRHTAAHRASACNQPTPVSLFNNFINTNCTSCRSSCTSIWGCALASVVGPHHPSWSRAWVAAFKSLLHDVDKRSAPSDHLRGDSKSSFRCTLGFIRTVAPISGQPDSERQASTQK